MEIHTIFRSSSVKFAKHGLCDFKMNTVLLQVHWNEQQYLVGPLAMESIRWIKVSAASEPFLALPGHRFHPRILLHRSSTPMNTSLSCGR
jgi:hypothetical protein